jgi:trehalose 6-phosphate phosphatase
MIDPFFMPRMYLGADPPELKPNVALFLDLDGTLIDIARTPSDVVVPFSLSRDLAAASVALGGALAIVSGRMLAEVDQLLTPMKFAVAGEHGAVIRMPDGSYNEIEARVPYEWVEDLTLATAHMRGVFIERKAHCLTAHYRNATRFEDTIIALAHDLVARDPNAFEVLDAKMAVEIRPRTVSKGRAVFQLMVSQPFAGRIPVFIGDDVSDQDGFAAARARGGYGYDVSSYFAGQPQEVRNWVRRVAAP